MSKSFDVGGMTCSACVAHVEKAVKGLPGVDACVVSLVTNSMKVEGSASDEDIIAAVSKAGYSASRKYAAAGKKPVETVATPSRAKTLARRLVYSLVFLVLLMYVGMGARMWNWPLPAFLDGNALACGLLEMLLCICVMLINGQFFSSGFRSLLHGSPNMDSLIALGSGASFAYSVVVLFLMTGGAEGLHLYFDSAAMILAFISVGKMLEARSMGRTMDALKSLTALSPETAVLLREGKEVEVPVEEVVRGDIFVLRPGDKVPVDGLVLEGSGAVDESSLTGESLPVEKSAGSGVTAACINLSGYMRCEATRVGEDTAFARIIRLVSDATASKAPIARIADRISAVFVPTVIGISLLTFAVWLICGESVGVALSRAVSVLVVSCPCALGLATPVAIVTGSGKAARNGILFKTAAAMETCGRVKNVVLDKTGTLTEGRAKVTDMIPLNACTEERLLSLALSLEKMSAHPLAAPVVEYARERGVAEVDMKDFSSHAGGGVMAYVDGVRLAGGNLGFVACGGTLEVPELYYSLAAEGKTPIMFVLGDELIGIIALADAPREDSAGAVEEMHELGLSVTMLTGDNELTARAIATVCGVENMRAGLLPEDKERMVRELSADGKTAMVGDGVNDAPSLAAADVGIAIGSGLDAARDAAEVVLMKNSLRDVAAAIRTGRAVLRNIKENLFWAFFYNLCGVPLAAGVFVPLTGWELSPMFCAAAMGLSSFCVVTNALRLNFFDPYRRRVSRRHGGPRNSESEGGNAAGAQSCGDGNMEKTCGTEPVAACSAGMDKNINKKKIMTKELKIEGMMCMNCEKHVKKALEAVPGVASAVADHTKGTASVELTEAVSDEALKTAVEEAGYTVV